SAVSLLFRVSDPAHRGRANGLFQGGFLLGGLAGPVLGGVLTEISARLSFFVYGAALAAAGLIGMLFLSRATVHPRRDRRPRAEGRWPPGLAAPLRRDRAPGGGPGPPRGGRRPPHHVGRGGPP